MSILLVDIGNSRIKWFFDSPNTPLTNTTLPHALFHHQENWQEALAAEWFVQATPLECRLSNVANDVVLNAVLDLIHRLYPNLPIQKITPQIQYGTLKLAYETTQMGADRYAQLLGAQIVCAEQDHLVVSAGTATTVDGVQAGGRHMGGIILPSMNLMRKSLHQYTAKLPLDGGQFCAHKAPTNTTDALASGAHLATIGTIQAFMSRYMKKNCPVILCGGSAHLIASDLSATQIHVTPALCLLGLKAYNPSQEIRKK